MLAFGLEKICLPHLGAMVTVLLELVITGAVYWFLLLMLRSFRGQDLNYVPGGKVLRALEKSGCSKTVLRMYIFDKITDTDTKSQ